MGTTSFTQMDVWKKAHQAVLEVYRRTREFPADERYETSAEMRKTARSIPANIAEGYGRVKAPDKARFYTIAQGSTEELKYYCILARDLGYLKDWNGLWKSLEDVSRMLRRLTQSVLRDA